MNKFTHFLRKFLIYYFPILVATTIWDYSSPMSHAKEIYYNTLPFWHQALWQVVSYGAMAWFLSLIIFMLLLVTNKQTQDSTVRYLANIKERDEREELLVGSAAKKSFITTTAVLIFLLFVSCFTFTFGKNNNELKKRYIAIGFQFLDSQKKSESLDSDGVILQHKDIPLSKSTLLLIVLALHVGSFKFRLRREIS